MVTVRPVRMAVRDFLRRSRAHIDDNAPEEERLTSQGMVAVDNHLAVGDIGDRVDALLFAVFSNALELHAHFNPFREQRERFDEDQLGIVFAKGVFRMQFHFELGADGFPGQGLLDKTKDSIVSAMQINKRIMALVNEIPVRVRYSVTQRDNFAFLDPHRRAAYQVASPDPTPRRRGRED